METGVRADQFLSQVTVQRYLLGLKRGFSEPNSVCVSKEATAWYLKAWPKVEQLASGVHAFCKAGGKVGHLKQVLFGNKRFVGECVGDVERQHSESNVRNEWHHVLLDSLNVLRPSTSCRLFPSCAMVMGFEYLSLYSGMGSSSSSSPAASSSAGVLVAPAFSSYCRARASRSS